MTTTYYAHTKKDHPPSEWELLETHLQEVSEMAAGFAKSFGAEEWARVAGLWHDLGKYSIEFQEYLCAQGDPHVGDVAEKVDHSSKGAQHAVAQIPVLGHLLAYVIAGHHSGLLDFHSEGACQFDRLQKALFTTEEAPEKVKRSEESLVALAVVKSAITSGAKNGFATAFFTRMFFSCLVDADFLATERFMSPEQSVHRPDWDGSILQDMRQALERRLEKFGEPKGEVDRHRSAVLWA